MRELYMNEKDLLRNYFYILRIISLNNMYIDLEIPYACNVYDTVFTVYKV